jgi:hypothetical protein
MAFIDIYTRNNQEMHDLNSILTSVVHVWSKKTKITNVFLPLHLLKPFADILLILTNSILIFKFSISFAFLF